MECMESALAILIDSSGNPMLFAHIDWFVGAMMCLVHAKWHRSVESWRRRVTAIDELIAPLAPWHLIAPPSLKARVRGAVDLSDLLPNTFDSLPGRRALPASRRLDRCIRQLSSSKLTRLVIGVHDTNPRHWGQSSGGLASSDRSFEVVTLGGMKQLVSRCPRLTELTLARVSLTPAAIKQLCGLHQLRKLSISGVSNWQVEAALRQARSAQQASAAALDAAQSSLAAALMAAQSSQSAAVSQLEQQAIQHELDQLQAIRSELIADGADIEGDAVGEDAETDQLGAEDETDSDLEIPTAALRALSESASRYESCSNESVAVMKVCCTLYHPESVLYSASC